MSTEQNPALPQVQESLNTPAPAQSQAARQVERAARPAVGLSLEFVTLLAAPVTVLATMIVGYVVLSVAGLTLHPAEMAAGAVVNTVGGLLAAVALMRMIKKGTSGIAQAGILGIGIRCGAVIVGIMIASLPLFALDRTVLVYWVMGYYFPMLIAESMLVAWLSHRAPN